MVAVDEGIRQDLVAAGTAENAADLAWYSDRLCALSTFSHYCGDEILAGAQHKTCSVCPMRCHHHESGDESLQHLVRPVSQVTTLD